MALEERGSDEVGSQRVSDEVRRAGLEERSPRAPRRGAPRRRRAPWSQEGCLRAQLFQPYVELGGGATDLAPSAVQLALVDVAEAFGL